MWQGLWANTHSKPPTLPLGQSRVLRSINKSNEGVFLARFSRPEALRVGSAIIEHHIIICWVVGLSGGFAGPPFKIWFRTLEVLTKKLVLSGSSEIPAGNHTIPRPIFSVFSIPNPKVLKFQHHYFIPTACDQMRLVLLHLYLFNSIPGFSGEAHLNAPVARPPFPQRSPLEACRHYQQMEIPGKQQAGIPDW